MKWERKIALRELPSLEMAAERWVKQWMLVVWLALWNGGKATYLSTSEDEMGIRAIYLMVQCEEPNYENETYYHGMVENECKQKTWHRQCMEGGNGTPLKEGKESSCEENDEEKTTRNYGDNSYDKDVKSWRYEIKNGQRVKGQACTPLACPFRAQAQINLLYMNVIQNWERRWWGMLSCAQQTAVASTLLGNLWRSPAQPWGDTGPPLSDVLQLADPEEPSRPPLRS